MLKVKKFNVALVPGKKLFSCHVQYDNDNFREIKGDVVSSKSNPSLRGLRNSSGSTWEVIFPDGTKQGYPTGQVIKLAKDIKINFGNGNMAEIY